MGEDSPPAAPDPGLGTIHQVAGSAFSGTHHFPEDPPDFISEHIFKLTRRAGAGGREVGAPPGDVCGKTNPHMNLVPEKKGSWPCGSSYHSCRDPLPASAGRGSEGAGPSGWRPRGPVGSAPSRVSAEGRSRGPGRRMKAAGAAPEIRRAQTGPGAGLLPPRIRLRPRAELSLIRCSVLACPAGSSRARCPCTASQRRSEVPKAGDPQEGGCWQSRGPGHGG